MALGGFYRVGLLVLLIFIAGCNPVPKCSDPETVNLLEELFYDSLKLPVDTVAVMKRYLKFNVTGARSSALDDKIKKNTCEASVAITFDPAKLMPLQDKFTFIDSSDKFMGNVSINPHFDLETYRSDIQFTVQKTEKDGLYASVTGLNPISQAVSRLEKVGVFNESKDIKLKKVYESDKSELFYDTNSVIKVGDAVQLLTIVDARQKIEDAFSKVEVTKFYCNTDNKYSILHRQYYREKQGEGGVIPDKDDFDVAEILILEPHDLHSQLWELACNKKPIFMTPKAQTEPEPTSAGAVDQENAAPPSNSNSVTKTQENLHGDAQPQSQGDLASPSNISGGRDEPISTM